MLTSWAVAAIVWGLFAVSVAVLVLRRRASGRGGEPGPSGRPGVRDERGRGGEPGRSSTTNAPDRLKGRDGGSG